MMAILLEDIKSRIQTFFNVPVREMNEYMTSDLDFRNRVGTGISQNIIIITYLSLLLLLYISYHYHHDYVYCGCCIYP